MSAGTDLQPDILGGSGDGRDLEAGLAVLGDQLAGVDVVLGRELGFDANSDPVRRAPVGVGHLNLWRDGRNRPERRRQAGGRSSDRTASPHLSFVRQPGLELLARVFGVLDVDELLVDRRRVVEGGLPAAVDAGHRRPDADGASEVIGHVHRHHVLHAQAEVCGTLDLKRRARDGS